MAGGSPGEDDDDDDEDDDGDDDDDDGPDSPPPADGEEGDPKVEGLGREHGEGGSDGPSSK